MSQTVYQTNREIGRIRELPYSVARSVAAEQLVRRVEAEGPIESLAYALFVQLESYTWGGEPAKAHVPFSRMLRLWDEHPEHFDQSDKNSFFWSFKWMVSSLADHPSITADQIEAGLAEMRRRYALAGLGSSGVDREAYVWARHRGSADEEELFATWVATPRDDFSQCGVCSLSEQAEHHADAGRTDEAMRILGEAVASGETCATEPGDLLSIMAVLQLEQGDAAAALSTHRKALAALERSESQMYAARGRRFELLARGGQPERAFRALAEDQSNLSEAETPLDRMRFLLPVIRGLVALDPAGPPTVVSLAGVPATTVGELTAWTIAESLALAAQFDARNGTDAWTRRVQAAATPRPAVPGLDFTVISADAIPSVDSPVAADAAPLATVTSGEVTDEVTADSAMAEAERSAAREDWQAAAGTYLTAAKLAQAAGRLEDSGLAYAEAAHCADRLGDDDGAQLAFSAAVTRLVASGAGESLLTQVLVAWAPVASRVGQVEALLSAAEATLKRVLADASQETDAVVDASLAERVERQRLSCRADLHDTIARVVASIPQPGVPGREVADAVGHARAAAEDYAKAESIGSAAHAFWLAGRIERDAGNTEAAQWCLESALEGFTIARDRVARADAGSDLIGLLQATGQAERAEQVASSLT